VGEFEVAIGDVVRIVNSVTDLQQAFEKYCIDLPPRVQDAGPMHRHLTVKMTVKTSVRPRLKNLPSSGSSI
jgi:hypothetical protein